MHSWVLAASLSRFRGARLLSHATALGLLLASPCQAMVPEPARVEGEIGGAESSPSAAPADRAADPIPPLAQPISERESLARIPPDLFQTVGVQLVLDRTHRQLMVLKDGQLTHRFPAAVGTLGWETPAGRHRVLEKVLEPIWVHPVTGERIGQGERNPLGSRWIGFYRDCKGRNGWDGEQYLDIDGCTVAGFHGTPYRWTVGRAVSHGCVRLYEENVQEVFDLVRLGTPVTVIP
jgi:L,D-transpeptidase ErfK/SrfK